MSWLEPSEPFLRADRTSLNRELPQRTVDTRYGGYTLCACRFLTWTGSFKTWKRT